MNTVYMLIGNIGSGKSTYAKKLSKNGVVISRDSLRYGIGGGAYTYNLKYEGIILSTAFNMFQKFIWLEENIILDEVNLIRKYRSRYITEILLLDYKVVAIEMERLTKIESVNRRMENPHGQPNRQLWNGVWERFDSIYEPPTYDEGFDIIYKTDGDRLVEINK